MGAEKDVDMIVIVIPLDQIYVITGSESLKNCLCPFGKGVIKHFPAVFHDENQVISQFED